MRSIAVPAFRLVARSVACIATIAIGILSVERPVVADEAVTFASALRDFQTGHAARALPQFEELAARGDRRAQYLLGITYLAGKVVPQDKSRGYAWLQVAGTEYLGGYAETTVKDVAIKAALTTSAALTGSELIAADRTASAFVTDWNRKLDADIATAKQRLASTAAESSTTYVTGCAADPENYLCSDKLEADPQRPNCTGSSGTQDIKKQLLKAEARDMSMYDRLVRELEEWGWEGAIILLADVDYTGYVCRVAIVRGSGIAPLDVDLLEYVRRHQFTPYTIDGQAVETLGLWQMHLGLEGLQFTPQSSPPPKAPPDAP